ncbi:MAG: LysR family transcriptional regulator [Oscillospiraceae bacterium]|nr:LysR family transcriptional regulator [Oscillospiraceae bacterium]MBR1457820.1 LysR family transcriptional regulator [Oscillospiraceae bacterium]
MTLQQLHYAIVISECGSMNKAAETLYIAQPSLTSSVKELEREIGIQIFNRSGKGVTLTADGAEFITYARQVYQQYEVLQEKYTGGHVKKKFGVSAQHYSFAVQAFVRMVGQFGTCDYEFAMRETRTAEVIEDVHTLRSEIGILYLSDFNRQTLLRLLDAQHLEFHSLISCPVYAYMWKQHPLADKDAVTLDELAAYPCLTFEQGDKSSFYFAEEIFNTTDFARVIKACDRSTMLNLMKGLEGYTFCSGIICNALNGSDYTAVPIAGNDSTMEIGYITRKNVILSDMGRVYLEELQKSLEC